MEDLTPEERAFLEQNPDMVAGTSLDLEATASGDTTEDEPEIDPQLKALMERRPDLDLSGTSIDPSAPISPVGGRTAVDVTQPLDAGQAAENDLTHGGLYGDRPSVGPLTAAAAWAGDLGNALGGTGRNEFQDERDNVLAEQEAWDQEAQRIYEETPGYINEDGQKVYKQFVGGDEEYIIPDPDSSAVGRAAWQAGRTLYQELGGLVTEGAIAGENTFADERPDMQLGRGEGFLSDLIVYGFPVGSAAAGAAKGTRATVNALRGADAAADATRATAAATGIAAITGGSVAEAVLSEAGDDGLVFDDTMIERWSNGAISGDAAQNTAMVLDGMLINGSLDGILNLALRGGGKVKQLARGGKQLTSKEYLRQAVQEGTLLNVVKMLDPEIGELPQRQFVQRLGVLSRLLEQESILKVTVGETTKDIEADSITAIMKGSEDYFREVLQGRMNSMSPEAFEAEVKNRAADMTSRMVGLVRSQQGSTAIRQTQARISNDIGAVGVEEARRIAGGDVDALAQSSGENLVRLRNNEIGAARDNLEDIDQQIRGVDTQAARVVQDNPVVKDLVEGVDGGVTYSSADTDAAVRSLIDDKLYPEFVRTADTVDEAYASIPNVPIDGKMLADSLRNIAKAANDLDGSGREVRAILRDIYAGFEPRPKSAKQSPLADPQNPDRTVEYETMDEVIERIEGDIGFQDLYQIKAGLADVIDSYADKPKIQNRLREFRSSITSEDGQLGAILKGENPDAARAAMRADNEFKAMQSRFFNEDTVGRLSEEMKKARRGESTSYPTRQGRDRPDVTRIGVNETIPAAVNDKSGVVVENLREALGSSVTDGDFNLTMANSAVEEARRELARAIKRGDTQSANMIEDAFEKVRPQLQKFGAEETLKVVDEAIDSVRQQSDDLLRTKTDLEGSRSAQVERMSKAENSILKDLVSVTRPGAARDDAAKVFRDLVLSKDSGNSVKAMREQAMKLPAAQQEDALKAIQAAALDTLFTRVFGATPVGMKSGTEATKNAKLGKLNDLTVDEGNNLQAGLREAFGADSDVAKQVADTLGQMYDSSISSRMQLSQAGSDTATNLDVREAVSTSILLTLGYMNPAAAAARRLTASSVRAAETEAQTVSKEVLEAVSTKPKEFAQMVDMIRRKEDPALIRKAAGAVFPELVNATARTARYNLRVDEEDDLESTGYTMDDLLGANP